MDKEQLQARTDVCLCLADAKHEAGEVFTFRDPDSIGFRELATAERAVGIWRLAENVTDDAEILARLSEFYLLHYLTAWTLRDGKGKPLALEPPNIRQHLLKAAIGDALLLADFADNLYAEAIFSPLVAKASRSLAPLQPEQSTSAAQLTSINGAKAESGQRRRRSRQSLTCITQTAATEATP